MIDFLTWGILSYILFDNLLIILLKLKFQKRDIGNYLGILHATIVVLLHTMFLLNYEINNIPVNWYSLSYGFTLGYGILDLINIFEYTDNFNYAMTMIFHHVLLIISMVYAYYITNMLDANRSIYISMGLMSEISTPLLNWIQIKKGNVQLWLKYMFVFLYLICRPINFTYLTYISYIHFGGYSGLSIISYMLTSLNYYWFYRIWLKTIMVEKEYNEAIKLLKPNGTKDDNERLTNDV